jgi:hypothetical protein
MQQPRHEEVAAFLAQHSGGTASDSEPLTGGLCPTAPTDSGHGHTSPRQFIENHKAHTGEDRLAGQIVLIKSRPMDQKSSENRTRKRAVPRAR